MDFVEICNVCTIRKAIIKAAKRISNSDKICRSYCDFYFGVTFLEHSVYTLIRAVLASQLKPVGLGLVSCVLCIFLDCQYQ